MPLEQRTFISPNDIFAFEYECEGCHARYLAKLDTFKKLLGQCPNCGRGLIPHGHPDPSKASDEAAVLSFIEALTELRSRNLESIRLEISITVPA
jgi:hypothetical protein